MSSQWPNLEKFEQKQSGTGLEPNIHGSMLIQITLPNVFYDARYQNQAKILQEKKTTSIPLEYRYKNV